MRRAVLYPVVSLILLAGFAQAQWVADTITVKGRVVDDSTTNPIAGALVTASFTLGMGQPVVIGSTLTDGNGDYILNDVIVSRIGGTTISAACDGYLTGSEPLPANPPDTVTLDYSLVPGREPVTGDTITVTGTVIDSADLKPVTGAMVVAYAVVWVIPSYRIDTLGMVTTGPDGKYTMEFFTEATTASFSCYAPGYYAATLLNRVLSPDMTVDFPLAPNLGIGKVIMGTVTDTGNTPLAGALVRAINIGGMDYFQATTDAAGNYVMAGIPASVMRVDMSASLAGCVTGTASRVNLNRDTTTQDFQLEEEPSFLTDPLAAGLSGITVRLYPSPARDLVTIPNVGVKQEFDFSLYATNGRQVIGRKVTGPALKLTDAGGGPIPAGMYFYLVRTAGSHCSGRLLIAR